MAKKRSNTSASDCSPTKKKGKTTLNVKEEEVSTKKGSTTNGASPSDALLGKMMELYMNRNDSSISFAGIMKSRGMNDRNTTWRNAWKKLIDDGYILTETSGPVFTSDYQLTDQGVEHSMTDEVRERQKLMSQVATTNEEHQAKIKKLHCAGWNGRGVQIFDLLLKHGSCQRKELAAIIGISDRGANFHYSLQRLLKTGHVEKSSNKTLRLSDKAFLNPQDRPVAVPMDKDKVAAGMEKVYGREMKNSAQKKTENREVEKTTVDAEDDKTD